MVRRTVNMGEGEPEQKQFDLPSEGEKLFQVVDVFEMGSEMGDKLSLDIDTVSVKCEVAIGDGLGRTLLNRLNLNETSKGFFATRLFLKAIGEEHKGKIDIDTDEWIGKQFFAEVVHNGKYANIKEYNFEKSAGIKQTANPGGVTNPADVNWAE